MLNGYVRLDDYNFLMTGTTSTINGYSATRFFVSNGQGMLRFDSVGTGGRSSVIFPIATVDTGAVFSYHPVGLVNAGSLDTYGARVITSVADAYSGATYQPVTALTSYAVNRSWMLNEGVNGGSLAYLTFQWNAANQLTGFSTAYCYVSRYMNGSGWISSTSGPASGTGPFYRSLNLVNTMGVFGIGSSNALPVTLLSFSGEERSNRAELVWTTASEKDNLGFEVERSLNGKDFAKAGFVEGKGNRSALNRYSFSEALPADIPQTGMLYYRLKQQDINGAFIYSGTITIVLNNNKETRIYAYPNPFTAYLQVQTNAAPGSRVLVALLDLEGRPVLFEQQTCIDVDGLFLLHLPPELKQSVYLLNVTINDNTSFVKVMKE